MNKIFNTLLASLVLFSALSVSAASIQWQTTRQGNSRGACQLESNTISLTVNPFYVDVVEEAIIGTRGDVNWGDKSTLEIFGDFTLAKGTAIRSMLLWNGNQILKAKLLDRKSADSAYQAVVNREIVRDPAIIEYLGNDTYRFRIYPVEINAARKIRILYAVPFNCVGKGPAFEIKTAFTAGASTIPTQIPVDVKKASAVSGQYLLSYGSINKAIQFGVTYMVSGTDLATAPNYYYYYSGTWQNKPITITPDTVLTTMAVAAQIASGNTAGHYTALYTAPPAVVLSQYKTLSQSGQASIEAKIMAGDEAFIKDINSSNTCLGVYLKSARVWDSVISWSVYNSRGKLALTYNQKFSVLTDSAATSMLPLLWGAKFSLTENAGSLGALYGFVDQQMSLLALEKDTLCRADALVYAQIGVPALKPSEIMVNKENLPAAPIQKVIFEQGNNTSVLSTVKSLLPDFDIALKGTRLSITLKNFKAGPVRVAVYDLSGKLIASWDNIRTMGTMVELEMPQGSSKRASSCMIVRVYSGNEMFQKKLATLR